MRQRNVTIDANPDSPWTYRETIDEAHSDIRVRGHVDRLAVDLLRGTVEELSRRGHRAITVTVEPPGSVDAYARAVLTEVAQGLEVLDCRLTVRWATDEDDDQAHRDRTVAR
jgi:hypothetical protein